MSRKHYLSAVRVELTERELDMLRREPLEYTERMFRDLLRRFRRGVEKAGVLGDWRRTHTFESWSGKMPVGKGRSWK